ncbi:hypothetical protein [Cupriavidus metallidurans]|uniref:Uncharacterized protein n=1 Tax=Cupriavidus metallidurans TaxID=119219 RepID=A0A482IT79_9BURK|nr:hypothetical protein [Cupriavidus metallidurans]QBP10020.1 hypothetical protein DDF84_009720 [Cupriavidus metallidurans]
MAIVHQALPTGHAAPAIADQALQLAQLRLRQLRGIQKEDAVEMVSTMPPALFELPDGECQDFCV